MDIIFDPSKEYTLYFRCNRDARAMTISFIDVEGDPYPVNSKTWQLNIKRSKSSSTNLIQLLSGEGLTINESSITIAPTATQTNVASGDYYFEIYNVTDKQTWVSGFSKFHNGVFEDTSTGDFTVTVNDSSLTRVSSTASGATLTPDISLYDAFERTAQAEPLTIDNPTGSIGNFEGFQIRLKSDGMARAFTMGNKFIPFGQAFNTEISATKTLVMTCIYNATNDTYMTATTEEV